MLIRLCLFFLTVNAFFGATGAKDYKAASAIPVTTMGTNGPVKVVRVRFTDAIDSARVGNVAQANLRIRSLPSGADLGVAGNAWMTAGSMFGIDVPYSTLPATGETDIEITFASLSFKDGHVAGPVTAKAAILSAADIVAAKQKALDTLQKTPKSTAERNIFASGFVTTASSGTAGGGDIALNSLDLGVPGLTSFLQIKKSSVNGGDPKNFEAGTRYQYAFVFGKAQFAEIHDHLAKYATGPHNPAELAAIAPLENQLQQRTFAAALIDFAAKFEGQATQFNVSNAVGDGTLSFQTMTKKLFGSSHGFWRVRLIPMGFEGGRNLNTTGQNQSTPMAANGQHLPDVSWIARLKGGSEFSLFYDNPESGPMKRVELTTGFVDRYLFFREARYDNVTKMILTTSDGNRPWVQVDLKFFIGEDDSARYGFKLTYQRGSLPPVFADTKTFQFGFLYETKAGGAKQ